eukprot:TRINITY_DN3631_c2_g1_i1.p1 TRINITY_DN3631_c2_g1~~TRINITY_DN3631_c2_g1_i1.p1  ORF type:complete len:202 (-),score=91.40 TRINITY_DN3631_c2_g1_i1:164-688(-)
MFIKSSVKPSNTSISRLHNELKELTTGKSMKEGFRVVPQEDNLFCWKIFLFDFPIETQIAQDLFMYESATGINEVQMEVLFPSDYPDSPPFLRVVRPRFFQHTGHITLGGSICIQDLTKSGWNPQNQLFQFIIMIRNLLVDGGALINMEEASIEYSVQEAREAFDRVAAAHGWQ